MVVFDDSHLKYVLRSKNNEKQNNEKRLKEGSLKCEIIFEDENFQNVVKMCFDDWK